MEEHFYPSIQSLQQHMKKDYLLTRVEFLPPPQRDFPEWDFLFLNLISTQLSLPQTFFDSRNHANRDD